MDINWDNLNVGHPELNHSERFFEKRHLKHERMDELALKKLLIAEQEKTNAIVAAKNKKNAEKNLVDVVEETVDEMKRLAVGKKALTTTNRFAKPPKVETKKAPAPVQEKPFVKPFKARPVPKYLLEKKQKEENKENTPAEVPKTKQRPAVAPVKPPPKRALKPTVKPAAAPRPVAEVAPRVKFNVVEPRSARKTMPTRPPALRISTSAPAVPSRISIARRTFAVPDTRRPKTAEPAKKFTAKVPSYLYKEPFKVSHDRKPIAVKPFSLAVTGRIDDRHKSDDARRKAIEAKNKRLEEERRKKEQEEWKNLRKQREFKARANPFNKIVIKKAVKDEAPKTEN